ncbi:MAG: hypothetical protein R8K22_02895, partial [Mariprofundaceae bacterium]
MSSLLPKTHIITLQGGSSLSDFRKQKLTQMLGVSELTASFVYLAEVTADWNESDFAHLAKVLGDAPRNFEVDSVSNALFVTPRVGTISPWSSKATDIVGLCGLDS